MQRKGHEDTKNAKVTEVCWAIRDQKYSFIGRSLPSVEMTGYNLHACKNISMRALHYNIFVSYTFLCNMRVYISYTGVCVISLDNGHDE